MMIIYVLYGMIGLILCNDFIVLEYEIDQYNIYANISVGSPGTIIRMKISQEQERSVISTNIISSSMEIIRTEIPASLTGIYYIIEQDYFRIGDAHSKIYFTYTNSVKEENVLSLSLKAEMPKFSFVYELNRNYFIKPQYAFIPQYGNKGKLIFGEIPMNLLGEDKGKCKVTFNEWGCRLKKIQIENYIGFYLLDINARVIFRLTTRNFWVTVKIMNYFNSSLFHHFNSCIYNNNEKGYICNCRDINDFPSINFHLYEDFIITLNKELLFNEDKNGRCNCNIKCNSERDNYYIFGGVFMEHFITLYEYSNKEIFFYHINTNSIVKNHMKKYIVSLYKIFILLLIFAIVFQTYILKNINHFYP